MWEIWNPKHITVTFDPVSIDVAGLMVDFYLNSSSEEFRDPKENKQFPYWISPRFSMHKVCIRCTFTILFTRICSGSSQLISVRFRQSLETIQVKLNVITNGYMHSDQDYLRQIYDPNLLWLRLKYGIYGEHFSTWWLKARDNIGFTHQKCILVDNETYHRILNLQIAISHLNDCISSKSQEIRVRKMASPNKASNLVAADFSNTVSFQSLALFICHLFI